MKQIMDLLITYFSPANSALSTYLQFVKDEFAHLSRNKYHYNFVLFYLYLFYIACGI